MARPIPLSIPTTSPAKPGWTFLSNHSHVLLVLARTPDARIRDIAEIVGITQRAVQRILADLVEGDVLVVTKVGRRNRYGVNGKQHLRHPVEAHRTVRDLVNLAR